MQRRRQETLYRYRHLPNIGGPLNTKCRNMAETGGKKAGQNQQYLAFFPTASFLQQLISSLKSRQSYIQWAFDVLTVQSAWLEVPQYCHNHNLTYLKLNVCAICLVNCSLSLVFGFNIKKGLYRIRLNFCAKSLNYTQFKLYCWKIRFRYDHLKFWVKFNIIDFKDLRKVSVISAAICSTVMHWEQWWGQGEKWLSQY